MTANTLDMNGAHLTPAAIEVIRRMLDLFPSVKVCGLPNGTPSREIKADDIELLAWAVRGA